jgi:hypothetical protein
MRRSLAITAALALLLAAAFAGVARADTTFGGNPLGTPTPVSCGQIVRSAPSCTLLLVRERHLGR